jgi:hypothetical protein
LRIAKALYRIFLTISVDHQFDQTRKDAEGQSLLVQAPSSTA